MDDDLEDLRSRLARLNLARLRLAGDVDRDALAREEAAIESEFGPSSRLAIYGTLAPGEANHHHVADLGGSWQAAAVRGIRGRVEHGIHRGLPGMRLDPAAPLQPVKLLVSQALPKAWARLDAFEGEEMQRLLVPLEGTGGAHGVANIYTLRRAMIEVLG